MIVFNYINFLLKNDTMSPSLVHKLTFLDTIEAKVFRFIEYIQYSDKYDKEVMDKAINILNESYLLVQNKKMNMVNVYAE